ncbi:MAG: metallophosphoesterase [Nanoarchaeota archaeon]|nr:metallophosphoesterase [Nanoarchaeota archaeon]MBU1005784.1 metallophosphoesterase [Nanoarchaeota archaeon]MBU1946927.1 metallophosphoesterase [Nanoarchaeota archaeon]
MEITKGIGVIGLSLYLKKENTLVISDTHIGYEESLNKQGVLIPRFQFKEIIKRLENIFKKTGKVDKIIINGDIKHEFGTISEQEWRHTLRLLDFLGRHCNELVLIKGNHDKVLGPIAEKRKVKVVEEYKVGSILIIHGDKIPDEKRLKGIKTIIIGHEHPAVSVKEGSRAELFKCFLKGKWKGRALIVQPSFNLVTEGTDVLKERLLSPFLKQDLGKFECFVVADNIYGFGKLNKL